MKIDLKRDWQAGRLKLRGLAPTLRDSIAARLFWLSAGWLIVALVATAFLLTELYSHALDTSLSQTLDFYSETLISHILDTGDPASNDIFIPDPRFSRSAGRDEGDGRPVVSAVEILAHRQPHQLPAVVG